MHEISKLVETVDAKASQNYSKPHTEGLAKNLQTLKEMREDSHTATLCKNAKQTVRKTPANIVNNVPWKQLSGPKIRDLETPEGVKNSDGKIQAEFQRSLEKTKDSLLGYCVQGQTS